MNKQQEQQEEERKIHSTDEIPCIIANGEIKLVCFWIILMLLSGKSEQKRERIFWMRV